MTGCWLASSRCCAKGLRETDELSRWGGEEFLVLLTRTDGGAAAALAERLCRHLTAAPGDLDGEPLTVTGSFGVAPHGTGEDLDACLKRADQALYVAKAQGRNRVVSFPAAQGPVGLERS